MPADAGDLVGGPLDEPGLVLLPVFEATAEASFEGLPGTWREPVERGDRGEFAGEFADAAEFLEEVLVGVDVLARRNASAGDPSGRSPK